MLGPNMRSSSSGGWCSSKSEERSRASTSLGIWERTDVDGSGRMLRDVKRGAAESMSPHVGWSSASPDALADGGGDELGSAGWSRFGDPVRDAIEDDESVLGSDMCTRSVERRIVRVRCPGCSTRRWWARSRRRSSRRSDGWRNDARYQFRAARIAAGRREVFGVLAGCRSRGVRRTAGRPATGTPPASVSRTSGRIGSWKART